MERVSIDIDESVAGSDLTSITLVTNDGECIEEPTTIALGAPDNPVPDRDLLEKYAELSGYVLTETRAHDLANAVSCLDCSKDARDLLRMLRGTDRGSSASWPDAVVARPLPL
jgi:hypothetical protein